ncbi:hypothetical protein [Algisphaera agarilytica]|uniref:Uncharacterized protein n=1 Tax=Algisphaera agarilytica TaxID=1385975 RepID=A0A7X0H8A7_9BACT|nr:hypothetical protein [Algisphaera agarilytica]MBB6431127.1 hypothetical protein [Algisphaera agarilytica]
MSIDRPFTPTRGHRPPQDPNTRLRTRLGVAIPSPFQVYDWFSDETESAVVEINSTLAKLAATKTKLEDENHAFKCADPVELTDKAIKSNGTIHERAITLFRDAMRACSTVIDVVKLVRKDAEAYREHCRAEVERLDADWIEKMVASGHYEARPYDSQNAGGCINWQGKARNSKLITAALGDLGNSTITIGSLTEKHRDAESGRDHNATAIRDSRAALASF